MQHAERWAPNATLELVARGAGWRAVLGRLGARCLLGLLTNGSVALFVGLGNGNYLQVAGRPVTEVRSGAVWGQVGACGVPVGCIQFGLGGEWERDGMGRVRRRDFP